MTSADDQAADQNAGFLKDLRRTSRRAFLTALGTYAMRGEWRTVGQVMDLLDSDDAGANIINIDIDTIGTVDRQRHLPSLGSILGMALRMDPPRNEMTRDERAYFDGAWVTAKRLGIDADFVHAAFGAIRDPAVLAILAPMDKTLMQHVLMPRGVSLPAQRSDHQQSFDYVIANGLAYAMLRNNEPATRRLVEFLEANPVDWLFMAPVLVPMEAQSASFPRKMHPLELAHHLSTTTAGQAVLTSRLPFMVDVPGECAATVAHLLSHVSRQCSPSVDSTFVARLVDMGLARDIDTWLQKVLARDDGAKDRDRQTPRALAAAFGACVPVVVEKLTPHLAELSKVTTDFASPAGLIMTHMTGLVCAQQDDINRMRWALQFMADAGIELDWIAQPGHPTSPLRLAAERRFLPGVRALVELGVDPTIKDERGWSALSYLMADDRKEIRALFRAARGRKAASAALKRVCPPMSA